jgi:hypothetical protein
MCGDSTKPEDIATACGGRKASVVITDEDALPSAYLVTKTTITPNKSDIKKALLLGESIPGASLSNGGVQLMVRRV